MSEYDKYRDSGVFWLGKIPEHWELKRTKAILAERNEKNDPLKTSFILSLGASYGVVPYSEKEGGGNKAKEDVTAYKLAYPGDIVMNSMNIISGSVGLSRYYGCVSPVYYMLYPKNKNISVEYYNLLFQTNAFQRSLIGLGNGIMMKESQNGSFNTVRMRIPIAKINVLLLPVPPMEEQLAICDYLNREIRKIDEIIAESKSSIEEYKKWKASIIFETITKGLDPTVEMKDSGIGWMGSIPKSWNLIKITRVLDRSHPYPIGDGDHGLVKTTDYMEDGIPYIRVQNLGWGTELNLDNVVYITAEKNETIRNSTLKPNDILFAKTGATIGKTGIIPEYLQVSNTTSHVGKITVSPLYNAKYVFYVLSSMVGYNQFWEIASAKTTRPELSIEEIKSIRITLPPTRAEQDLIVHYLDEKCPHIDELITEKELLIEDLEAFKKPLIFEVVTGKRRVME